MTYKHRHGIKIFLPPDRATGFAEFLKQYGVIRRREQWGRSTGAYYRSLPKVGRDDPNRDIWNVRCRTFRTFVNRTLTPLERIHERPLRVIDLGTGNGWLANRLASRGHHVAAVDVQTDELDGLGAHTNYTVGFTSVQAEFDRLPFAGGQFDLAVFNASMHYSTDCKTTIGEAFRVLRHRGILVILDTPAYRNFEEGRRMVNAREREHFSNFGFASSSLDSEHFLTPRKLNELARHTGASWSVVQPYHGPRWVLRRIAALILRRRPPARFPIISTIKPPPSRRHSSTSRRSPITRMQTEDSL